MLSQPIKALSHRACGLVLFTALGLVAAGPTSAVVVVYDNTKAVTNASDLLSAHGPFYDSFSNVGGAAHLDSIAAMLSSSPGETNPLSKYNFELLTDNGGKPGAVIESATHFDLSLSQTPTVIDAGLGGVNLAADTRYWVEMVSPDQSSFAKWGYSLDTTGTGVLGEFFGVDGGFYSNLGRGPFQMKVAVTPLGTPEPATWAMMMLGLGGIGAVLRRRQVAADCVHAV